MSRAGKELLNNTIQSVTHQNRVLEERCCWRSLSISSRREVLRVKRRSRSEDHTGRDREQERVVRQRTQTSSSSDKWDHSGFLDLYPDRQPSSLSTSSSSSDSDSQSTSSDSSASRTERRKKRKSKRRHHSKKKRRKHTD